MTFDFVFLFGLFFQFYLSLYGHKLPVLCLDISYDSTLIATGSGDRNVKIWGMDFGDCHKSIFAHNDSVTALQFVPSTHYFFTASKDGKIKQWDADTYENIITLNVSICVNVCILICFFRVTRYFIVGNLTKLINLCLNFNCGFPLIYYSCTDVPAVKSYVNNLIKKLAKQDFHGNGKY